MRGLRQTSLRQHIKWTVLGRVGEVWKIDGDGDITGEVKEGERKLWRAPWTIPPKPWQGESESSPFWRDIY